MKKLFVKTYGCQMNVYDSARMADLLAPLGYGPAEAPEDADMVILNTCHIREKAAEKIYSELGRLKKLKEARARSGGAMTIAVAGCVAQAEGAEILARQSAVDLVVGPQSYHRLPEMIAKLAREGGHALETDFPAEDQIRFPARAGVRRRAGGLSHRAGRLRQVLHLLRRALHQRQRIFAPRRSHRRRSARAWSRKARAKSRCSARTSMPIAARGRTARHGRWPV